MCWGAGAAALSECSSRDHFRRIVMFIVNLKRCAVLAGVAHNAVAIDSKFFSICSKLASSLWSPTRCAPPCPRPNVGCAFFLRNYACFLSRQSRVLVSMVCASSSWRQFVPIIYQLPRSGIHLLLLQYIKGETRIYWNFILKHKYSESLPMHNGRSYQ